MESERGSAMTAALRKLRKREEARSEILKGSQEARRAMGVARANGRNFQTAKLKARMGRGSCEGHGEKGGRGGSEE